MENNNALGTRQAFINRFVGKGDRRRWTETDMLSYKPTGSHFRDITRQVLFGEEDGLPAELRYFEIEEEGYSTLERHEHVHAVMILAGRGEVLLGDRVDPVDQFDTVYVPPMTWHQFRASRGSILGFLCLVACDRDRPHRPTAAELEELDQIESVRQFIRV